MIGNGLGNLLGKDGALHEDVLGAAYLFHGSITILRH
jgi:hypothetical protein